MSISFWGIQRRLMMLEMKAGGLIPGISWKQCFEVLIKQNLHWAEFAQKLSTNSESHICLYRVPGFPKPLWLPDIDAQFLELDIELLLHDYYHGVKIAGLIHPGDVVFDCGGYVGLFSMWAVSHGASKVVVFEPLAINIECIQRNLREEIDQGKVIVHQQGVWSHADELRFHVDKNLNGSSLIQSLEDMEELNVPVVTIDSAVAELKLERVDLIKMDIEGAEREAVLGAKETLRKHHPQLAICTYHLKDDPQVIARNILSACPDYGTVMQRYSKKSRPSIDLWCRRNTPTRQSP